LQLLDQFRQCHARIEAVQWRNSVQEKEIRLRGEDLFNTFWELWCSREIESVRLVARHTAEDFSGIGTNKKERWYSRQDLLTQLEEEWRQVPVPYAYSIKRIESIAIAPETVLVMGDVDLDLHINERSIALDSVRSTQIYQIRKDIIKLIHWHCSIPDGGISGEVAPGSLEPKPYKETTVLFCDFVNYTEITNTVPEKQLVDELNIIYSHFDGIMEQYGIEKLQITGDGYVAVCGLPEFRSDHAQRCLMAARQILTFLDERSKISAIKLPIRIGIHSGPVRAGVFGRRKFGLNVFGDTVNIASRLESASEPDRINISAYTHKLVQDTVPCEFRGKIAVKGKGKIAMYFVI
jgi:class 3 adenylate cyclase